MKLEKLTNGPRSASGRWYDDACGTALALELVGERWALLIVRELMLGGRRFGELRANLPGISANVLTQRLAGLEGSGIVRRRRLPPPASVQVYELTPWGLEAEGMVLELGRWALRSPAHDGTLHFTPVALMLSFRMLVVPERIGDFSATLGFRLGEEGYLAQVSAEGVVVGRGDPERAQAVFTGEPRAFLAVLYGNRPLGDAVGEGKLAVTGDWPVAERFSRLFALPSREPVPGSPPQAPGQNRGLR